MRSEPAMRRVVITGMGMLTPLGCGVEATWARLLKGESGAKKIDTFEVSDIACKIACVIPRGDGTNATYNPDQWMEPKEQRKVDEFIVFAMCAARQALDDAGWHPKSYEEQATTGVLVGSGIGGIEGIAETAVVLHDRVACRRFLSPVVSSILRRAMCRLRSGSKVRTIRSSRRARRALMQLEMRRG